MSIMQSKIYNAMRKMDEMKINHPDLQAVIESSKDSVMSYLLMSNSKIASKAAAQTTSIQQTPRISLFPKNIIVIDHTFQLK